MIALRTIAANDQLLEAELDGLTYFLRLSWNETGGMWTMGVQDAADTALVNGVAVVIGWPLMRQHRSPSMPAGDIFATLISGDLDRLAFRQGRAGLVYVSRAEMLAAGWSGYQL